MVEDVVVGFEDAVREPIVAHELPDVLDRIELGRFRRKRQERDVVRDGKLLRDMRSRLIEEKDGMRAWRDRDRVNYIAVRLTDLGGGLCHGGLEVGVVC